LTPVYAIIGLAGLIGNRQVGGVCQAAWSRKVRWGTDYLLAGRIARAIDTAAPEGDIRRLLAFRGEWWRRGERTGISLPRFTTLVPELIDRYVQAFEKVWAHRQQLGRA